MNYSGGQTQVRTLGWLIMNLGKLTGAGAGRNDGLLPVHGKAVPLLTPLVQRKQRTSRLRLVKTQICQLLKHQFHLSHLCPMGGEP